VATSLVPEFIRSIGMIGDFGLRMLQIEPPARVTRRSSVQICSPAANRSDGEGEAKIPLFWVAKAAAQSVGGTGQ
jgi:hypothetical protein